MTPALLARLTEARQAGAPTVLLTRLPDGAQALWPEETPEGAGELIAEALRRDAAFTTRIGPADWLLEPFQTAPRLIVVGAVHIAQALVPMAAALPLALTVIDPRRAFATDERFPGVTLSHDWPDDALAALAPDARTAVVTLTHDPKLDDPALDQALRSPAGYIGALGSRRTHARRLERLAALGHGPAALARIRGPVGLDIGAVTASEIALSILAELVAARRKPA